jgi:hypothetical protein
MERLTGAAYFTPAGGGPTINLGAIEMMRLDYGLKSIDIMRSRRGMVYPRKRHFHQRSPVFEIKGTQFATSRMALQLAGTRLANTMQDADGFILYVFTAMPGAAYSIGSSVIFIESVMVGSDTKVLDYDFYIDTFNGWIWLPENGGTIVAGDVVEVRYSRVSQEFEVYTAIDTPSRDGVLTVYAEDHLGPPAREKWVMDVTISVKGMPDTDPAKFRTWSMEALILGNPTVYKRPQQQAWAELITDTGAVIDLS